MSGGSCPPGSAVTFAVEGAPAGAATARPDGTFEGTVQLPDTSIGAHVIQAMCGGRTASAPIDLVVSSASSAPSGAGATVAAVFLFFLLLGSVLLTRNHGRERAGEPD
ncbi:MAG: hypothetical protein JWO12_158 [Frankiales bacterium]|nr:hypothetical protein [Frankiales bacterium]